MTSSWSLPARPGLPVLPGLGARCLAELLGDIRAALRSVCGSFLLIQPRVLVGLCDHSRHKTSSAHLTHPQQLRSRKKELPRLTPATILASVHE